MIDCPNSEIRDQLPDFINDRLNAAARAAVAAHVARCAACATELALLRELRGTLRSGPAVDIARIVAALPAPSRAGRGGRVGRADWRRLDWRVAAAIAALVIGGGSAAVLSGRLGEFGVRDVQVTDRTPTEEPNAAEVAAVGVSIDADLGEATVAELEALLEDLDAFDGLPAREPDPPPTPPVAGEEGL